MFAYSGNANAGKESASDQETLKEATASHVEVHSISSEEIPDDLIEELESVMAGMTLKDEPADKEIDRATQLVQAYLFKYEPEFQRVMVYRDRVSPSLHLEACLQSMWLQLTSNRDGTITRIREIATSRRSARMRIRSMTKVKRDSIR
jgi:hypothetical protein